MKITCRIRQQPLTISTASVATIARTYPAPIDALAARRTGQPDVAAKLASTVSVRLVACADARAYRLVVMFHFGRLALPVRSSRLRQALFAAILVVAALLVGYYLGGAHGRRTMSIDELVARAYGHDVGHCEVNRVLTEAIRKAGGGQTGYVCGKERYSAIIDVSGNVAKGGVLRAQP